MNANDVAEWIARIDAIDDPVLAASEEDALRRAVLTAIADGSALYPHEVARLAMRMGDPSPSRMLA